MKQRPRIYYSDSQKALMWERWKQGATLHQIAGLFGRMHSSVHRILAETGGIRPPRRRRSSRALRLTEREEISRAVVTGESIRLIAARLERAPSTVAREIRRNGGRAGYRAALADQAAWDRALRPKTCKLAENRPLARIVSEKLRLVVARADCGVAQAYLSVRPELPRVTRNDLPQLVHSSPWGVEEGAAAALETHARDAPFAPSHAEDRYPRQDHRRRVDQRASRHG